MTTRTLPRIDAAAVAQNATTLADTYRTTVSDGSARVLVADRRIDRNAADVRVRQPQRVTVRRAANSLAHRWGWTREMVLAHYGVEDSREIARGELRNAYIAEQGIVRVDG